MHRYKKSNILILPHISESDFTPIDDIFEDKFKENIIYNEHSSIATSVVYKALPSKFKNIEDWPKTTNLHCWECDNQFKTMPLFIINSITKDELDGREVFDVLGCFHSWRCMYSYILRNYSSQQLDDKTRYMQYLYKVLNLVKMPLIQPADKKTIMKKYSGDTGISPEEYLKEN